MSDHAVLAPSGAGQWGPGGCPASVWMQAAFPEREDSPAAIEGTAAHYYGSEKLQGRDVVAGSLAPNGHPVTAEMVVCGDDYVRDVLDTVSAASPGYRLGVEQRLSMARSVHPDAWGTSDAYLVDFARKVIHVWDYKFGHRYVDVYRCWQLVMYAVGVFESLSMAPPEWSGWTVTMTICQPRNFHPDGPIREWQVEGAQLAGLAAELKEAANTARLPNPPFKTGTYCLFCTAALHCSTLQQAGFAIVDYAQAGTSINLPPAAVSIELVIVSEALDRLKARKIALEEEGLEIVRAGGSLANWQGEYSGGRVKWKDESTPEMVAAIADMYGIEARKPPAVLTPQQLGKAGFPDELIKEYAHQPRGALTLVPFSMANMAKRFG